MQSGDACPRCGAGRIGVLNTVVHAEDGYRVRSLGCRGCGFRPDDNKRLVPLEYAPPQQRVMQRLALRRR